MFSILRKIRKLSADPDIAIDLGTANTRPYAVGRGIIADEPSLVPIDQNEAVPERTDTIKPVKRNISALSPLNAGVITDVNATVSLLKPLLKRVRGFSLIRPRALACAPADTSETERKALAEATLRSGVSKVAIIPEPLAAAIGAGIDIGSPYAQMLVDIGDGVTDIAVFQEGHIIKTASIRQACSNLKSAVRDMVLQRYKTLLYNHEAERLMQHIESIHKTVPQKLIAAAGADLEKCRDTEIEISNYEVVAAMEPIISRILRTIEVVLHNLPHEKACEVIESGICLTGGGACIKGMDKLIASRTKFAVRYPEDPLHAVINGAIEMLQYGITIDNWWENVIWPISPSMKIPIDC